MKHWIPTLALSALLANPALAADCRGETLGEIGGAVTGLQVGSWISGLLCTGGLLLAPVSGGFSVLGCAGTVAATSMAGGFAGAEAGGALGRQFDGPECR